MRQDAHKLLDFLFDLGEKAKKKSLIPDQAKVHFRQAQKEGMLGLRMCIDHYIGKLDQSGLEEKIGPQKIQIEE